MKVDLSSGAGGEITFSDGMSQYTALIEKDSDEDSYLVRIEDGWYNRYKKNGEAICSGQIVNKEGEFVRYVKGRDIVKFEPEK